MRTPSTGQPSDQPEQQLPQVVTETLPFPVDRALLRSDDHARRMELADRAMHTVRSMSRRIDDLARELHCLGHFDDDDHTPRAA